jgi:hypothetical protein
LRLEFFAERYTNRYFHFDTPGLFSLLDVNRKIQTLDIENAGFLCDSVVIELARRIPCIEVLNIRYLYRYRYGYENGRTLKGPVHELIMIFLCFNRRYSV